MKLKNTENDQVQSTQSKSEKRDILTEMFESFGIKVIDVSGQILKFNKRKKLK